MRSESDLLGEIDAIRERLEAHRPYSAEASERIRRWFTPRAIGCSTALGVENALSGPEIAAFLEREVVSGGHPLESFLAVRRHEQTLDLVAQHAQAGAAVDVAFIQKIHRSLTEGAKDAVSLRPGSWKTSASPLTRRRGHEFRYAPPEEVPGLMKLLLEELSVRLASSHPLKATTWFYFHFEHIHPFESDNGQVARLVATCLLTTFGFPPLLIRPDLLGDYLDALKAVRSTVPADLYEPLSPRFDVHALLEFFCSCLVRTGERMLDIASGRHLDSREFSTEAKDSQERLLAQFLARKSMSWRVGATFEVRELFRRVSELMGRFELEGPIYSISFLEPEVIATHAVSAQLRPAVPMADAGLVGEARLVIRGDPRLSKALQFPAEQVLKVAVTANEHGLQLILAWTDGKPKVHHGPARASEWPESTLDDHLTRAVDKRRLIYEGTLREGNAPPSQKHKVLGAPSGKHTVVDTPEADAGPLPPLRKGL